MELPAKFSLLISMNGSLASQGKSTGGGDLVLFKFIRLSGLKPDLLLPVSAKGFAVNAGRFFPTCKNNNLSLLSIIWLFLVRTVQGIWHARHNQQKYDVALSASPFAVDVIPVWFWKARHKGAVIYHINPERRAVNLTTFVRFGLAAIEQKITMAILRCACDFILAGNEFVKGQLEARLPGKPIFVLPAGFNAEFIDGVPAETKDPNLACFIGRTVSQKGIFDLLQVMTQIAQIKPDFKLVMVGTGPERDFFVAELERLKLKNVQLAGFVSETGKISLLKRSTYFFFPSYEEGWGIALAEALYCECRCVCYELPHYRSIFGEFPAYAKLGDPEDFLRIFQVCGPLPAGQKEFMRQYDDPQVVRQMIDYLVRVTESSIS